MTTKSSTAAFKHFPHKEVEMFELHITLSSGHIDSLFTFIGGILAAGLILYGLVRLMRNV